MTNRQCVEMLDRSLQDIMGYELPFGGNVMAFGGDFRQVLPRCATRYQVTNYGCHYVEILNLERCTEDMSYQKHEGTV
jgi:hypothetical protein